MVANEKWFGGAGATTGMYSHQILHSCRFDASASSRLYRTFGTPSSTTKFSISFWIKIPNIPGYSQIFSKDNGYAGGGASILLEDDLGGGAGTVNIMTMYGKWMMWLIGYVN